MKRWRHHWPVLALVLVLLFVTAVRWRVRAMPLERDEGEYAYAGQLMLDGIPPYRWLYNFKMPGIYAAYALIMAVFGQTPSGIHVGFLLANLAAIVLTYRLSRRFLDPPAAAAAAATYALLSLSQGVVGMAAHATHLVVLAALGGLILLLRGQERGRLGTFFWSGALCGVAFLMKQPGGAFAFLGLSVLAWAAWRERPVSWGKHGGRMAAFATGALAPVLLTFWLLWRAGVWAKFWFWTVTYARVHATLAPWSFGRERLAVFFGGLGWDAVFWVWAALGLGCVLAAKKGDKRFFPVALLAFSVAAVCPTFHFYPHYFVLLLPAIALLTGEALAAAAERKAPWIFFAACWVFLVAIHREAFFKWKPDQVSGFTYWRNAFQVYPPIGEYLKTNTPAGATLAVLGSEPELLFYAHRRSVTGYIYMYDVVEDQPLREQMEREMIGEVERGRPDFVIFVNSGLSWIPSRSEDFEAIKQWMEQYTDKFYEPYGLATFPPYTIYWGKGSFQRVPSAQRFVWIFKRKGNDNPALRGGHNS
ncbi:MAG: glycosyltransferase family 39 protein [Verrucomicrobiota bacterium]|jgi:4-amino-4-deoxy-L-arabinose transferase-like glycosyltransferase